MSQFRIDEKISESGSTTVYRAFQETLRRPVLLKVLHQHLTNDPVVRERFTREAQSCAHLRSEHIVHVYDLTEYNGCPAIIMEFVQGRSLKEIIAEAPPDRHLLARKVAVSILRALSVANHRGIVHRDIKPGNILVADDGTVKLTDFGLAFVAHSPTVTMEGTVLGTPAYMAPEQIRGDRVDAKVDFFSLGVTLVEVLTGERIFEGSDYSECVKKIAAFRSEDVNRLTDKIPSDLLGFLKRLMEPDPANRFQSAGEALKALNEEDEKPARPMSTLFSSRNIAFGAIPVAGMLVAALLFYLNTPRLAAPDVKPDSVQQLPQKDTVMLLREGKTGAENHSSMDQTTAGSFRAQPRHQAIKDSSFTRAIPVRDSAKVTFTSNPWAKVYVDGRLVGETPISQSVSLGKGRHQVMFSHPAFDPILKTIDVRSEREQVVSADFMQNAGFLQCAIRPWAEVYVDEQYKDTTPLSKPIILSAGNHRVRFHNNAFTDTVQEISITRGDTLRISISLSSVRIP